MTRQRNQREQKETAILHEVPLKQLTPILVAGKSTPDATSQGHTAQITVLSTTAAVQEDTSAPMGQIATEQHSQPLFEDLSINPYTFS
jgi:hypothetical protein